MSISGARFWIAELRHEIESGALHLLIVTLHLAKCPCFICMFRVVKVACAGAYAVTVVSNAKLRQKCLGAVKLDVILDGGIEQMLLDLAVNLDKRL